MLLLLRSFVLSVTLIWFCSYSDPCDCSLMRITSVILERPVVDYCNDSIGRIFNLKTRRISRSDNFHYLQFFVELYVDLDCQNTMVHISIDELLSNTYRPTFVQIAVNSCELTRLIIFNVSYARNSSGPFNEFVIDKSKEQIIYPTGVYDFHNIMVPSKAIPDTFPFQNGRINIKFIYKNSLASATHVDLHIKMLPKRKYSPPPK